jgi:hypothetical protein
MKKMILNGGRPCGQARLANYIANGMGTESAEGDGNKTQ